MAIMRRIGLVALLLLSLTVGILAQSAQLGAFVDKLEALVGQRNVNGAAQLVEANPQVAREAFIFIARTIGTMEPEVQQEALLMLNVIARTFQVRSGNTEMAQALAQSGKALADSVWQGTVLAGNSAGPGPGPGPRSGGPPGPPAGPTGNFEAIAALCVSVGNFADAESSLRQALAQRPGAAAERRIKRQIAACRLGQGLPHEALQQVEELLKSSSDTHEKLASELLASHCAYRSGQRQKLNEHIARARALAAIEPAPFGPVARFILESHQLRFDLLGNPDMSVDEILRRHAKCWGDLKTFKPASKEDLSSFTSELWWMTEVFDGTWLWSVGTAKVRPGEDSDPRLKEIGSSFTVLLALGPELARLHHFEVLFSNLSLAQATISASIGGGSFDQARSDLARLETSLTSLYQVCQKLQKDIGNAPVSTTRGAVSRILARHYELKAQLSLALAKEQVSAEARQSIEDDLSRAEAFAEQADSVDTPVGLMVTRLSYLEKARPANWQQLSQESLTRFSRIPGATAGRFAQQTLHHEQGRLFLAQGRADQAIGELQKAVEIRESLLRESGASASSSRLLRNYDNQVYEDLARAQVLQGKSGDAFQTFDRMQQVENFGAFKPQDLKKRLRGADQASLERASEAQARLQMAEQEVAALGAAKAEQSKIDKANQLLASSRSAYYACVSDLEKKYPEFRKLDIKPINFAKLQRSIPPNTLVVQFFSTRDELYILEATRENVLARKVGVSQVELKRLSDDFRRRVAKYQSERGDFNWSSPEAAELKKTVTQLYAHLIGPIEAELGNKEALAVIPFDFLLHLPFQALASESGGKLQFLIEKKQVVVLCKAADLDQVFGSPAVKTGSLVAFGNPDGTLAGAGEEAKALKDLFPGSKVYLTSDATLDRLASVQSPAVSYLHFATHGILSGADPRQSYLVMARGRLAVADIVGYRLDGSGSDLNLVTLSACKTALGERNQDGSDLRGLADAFSLAGCRSVVASLWSVDDQSTRELMVEFYKELKAGKSKAQALQLAQTRLLTQAKYRHPFYWAPFILIGDWR